MTNDPRMVPETRLDIEVEVLVDGHWWPGFLEHWRHRDGRWEGDVRWTEGPGMNHIGWYDQNNIRQATT